MRTSESAEGKEGARSGVSFTQRGLGAGKEGVGVQWEPLVSTWCLLWARGLAAWDPMGGMEHFCFAYKAASITLDIDVVSV